MEKQDKAPEQELKKAYLNEDSFKNGKKLFCCDVLTGKVTKVKPKKDYFKHQNTGVITKKLYVMTSPNLFYLMAEDMENAKESFQKQFDEMAKELESKEGIENKNT